MLFHIALYWMDTKEKKVTQYVRRKTETASSLSLN